MKLVLIRHPETNKIAGLPGEQEAPSPVGYDQLAQVADICRKEGVKAVVYSPQMRTAVAAEALVQSLQVPKIELKELQERNFGDWDDWEWPQITAKLNKMNLDERYTFVPPNGESWKQMEERLRVALEAISKLHYDTVAVMTHAGPIRALLPILRHEPKDSTLQLNVENGRTFILNYDPTSA